MDSDRITSRRNQKIRIARSLQTRKGRDQSGLFLVEGIRHVGAAVEAGAPLEFILYAPDLLTSEFAYQIIQKVRQRDVPCYPTSAGAFESTSERVGPQGILAVARQHWTSLSDLSPSNFPWGVAVIQPQDPGNLGTLLRTIDAAGASGLLLLGGGTDPWHPTAVRASMGTLFWLLVAQTSFEQFTEWTHEHSYPIYGTSTQGAKDYREINYTQPCLLLLGSEREGLTDAQMQVCKAVARLPMHGRASSLNLAVAAGIILYKMGESVL